MTLANCAAKELSAERISRPVRSADRSASEPYEAWTVLGHWLARRSRVDHRCTILDSGRLAGPAVRHPGGWAGAGDAAGEFAPGAGQRTDSAKRNRTADRA